MIATHPSGPAGASGRAFGEPRAGARAGGGRVATCLDLRRREARAALIAQLAARADLLPPEDRALLKAVYERGMPVARLAELRGGPAEAGTLRRRLRRLVERVLSPEFEFVARHRAGWSAARRRIATAMVLHGLSQRQAAAALGLSPHVVRRHRDAVRALFDAAVGAGGSGRSGA